MFDVVIYAKYLYDLLIAKNQTRGLIELTIDIFLNFSDDLKVDNV